MDIDIDREDAKRLQKQLPLRLVVPLIFSWSSWLIFTFNWAAYPYSGTNTDENGKITKNDQNLDVKLWQLIAVVFALITTFVLLFAYLRLVTKLENDKIPRKSRLLLVGFIFCILTVIGYLVLLFLAAFWGFDTDLCTFSTGGVLLNTFVVSIFGTIFFIWLAVGAGLVYRELGRLRNPSGSMYDDMPTMKKRPTQARGANVRRQAGKEVWPN